MTLAVKELIPKKSMPLEKFRDFVREEFGEAAAAGILAEDWERALDLRRIEILGEFAAHPSGIEFDAVGMNVSPAGVRRRGYSGGDIRTGSKGQRMRQQLAEIDQENRARRTAVAMPAPLPRIACPVCGAECGTERSLEVHRRRAGH